MKNKKNVIENGKWKMKMEKCKDDKGNHDNSLNVKIFR